MIENMFKIAAGLVVVAGIYNVVRPGSQGPAAIAATLNGFGGDLRAATGR